MVVLPREIAKITEKYMLPEDLSNLELLAEAGHFELCICSPIVARSLHGAAHGGHILLLEKMIEIIKGQYTEMDDVSSSAISTLKSEEHIFLYEDDLPHPSREIHPRRVSNLTAIRKQRDFTKKDKQYLDIASNISHALNDGLYGACAGGHMNCVDLLVASGATDFDGGFGHACKSNQSDAMNLMKAYGAMRCPKCHCLTMNHYRQPPDDVFQTLLDSW